MPSNYRYPGKSDFEKQTKAGRMSDANESSLYREKMEKRLLGETDNPKPFAGSVAYPSTKGSVHTTMSMNQRTIKQGEMG
ncbi:MAG TPA: hypothetical protein QF698_01595 [Candidatus Marinimicrobia bacterium]|jgi:hypothetical protein|nr:hypothetical protein [Gimesia sp.]HJM94738.1 hypothetical protein [Candidatus Neomarinimicrobiota bacterium]|tara:strand:- start:1235 stop:1474 length:240 start_codon:yes stop_codon:yes gene_type:complete